MINEPLFTAPEFFEGMFPQAYVFALREEKGQAAGDIPSNVCKTQEDFDKYFEEKFFALNNQGWGVHFTPNAIKDVEMRNKKENFAWVNAWWCEIDTTQKNIIDNEDMKKREDLKAEILGKLFMIDCKYWPSLVNETRNGFHVYWLAIGGTANNHLHINTKLCNLLDGDKAAVGIMHSLRVPYFRYDKSGEQGVIEPVPFFSTLRQYTEQDMLDWLGVPPQPKIETVTKPDFKEVKIDLFSESNPYNIIKGQPIKELLERLSGNEFIHGDRINLVRTSEKTYNLLCSGHSKGGLWINIEKNMIFSNTHDRFNNIFNFLALYQHDYKESLNFLLQLLKLSARIKT